MKRILTYVTMLTLAVACKDLYGPEETPLTPDKAGSIEISISDVTDNSFKVTVSPSGEASYYSYLVDESETAYELEADKIYAVSYSSVAQGTVKWTKENPSYTFTVNAAPNTTYQVYAVAGSPMGNPGEIVVKSVKTSDAVCPELTSFAASSAETTVQLSFSEDVAAAGDITVRYFKRWTATNDIYNDTEAGSVTVPASEVAVDGNTAVVAISGIPAGAYYTVAYGEGAFVDMAGNSIAAIESGFYTTETGSLSTYGLYGRAPFQSFDVAPLEDATFADYATPFVTGFNTESAVVKGANVTGATAIYNEGSKVTTYQLTYGSDYGFAQGYCVVYLPEEPARGADVTVTIPADTFTDEWGNGSNEFTFTSKYSYGYTLDAIIGSYNFAAYSAYSGELVEGTMVIAESDDPEQGNVMFTTMYGTPCEYNVYATFDMVSGTLTVPSLQIYGSNSMYLFVFTASTNTGEISDADVVFSVPQAGVFGGQSCLFGDAAADPATYELLGFFDIYTGFQAVRVEEEAATMALSSVKTRTLQTAQL